MELAAKTESTELVHYDAMCLAIDRAYEVDEVKEIRDKALALEAYFREAKNREPERRAAEIRVRAERRAGELLKAMEKPNGGRPTEKTGTCRVPVSNEARTLSDLGISKKQSSHWQQLATVPKEDFEAALAEPEKPSTKGIIKRAVRVQPQSKKPAPKVNIPAIQDGHQQSGAKTIAAIDRMADGERYSDAQITKITNRADPIRDFIYRVQSIPWLTIDRTTEGTLFRIDEDLRAICEQRRPRPELQYKSISDFLRQLRSEITRRRKENNDEMYKRNWSQQGIQKQKQTDLLDWIEEQLDQVPTL